MAGLDIANVVELQSVQACPLRPKLEDHTYQQATKLRLGKSSPFYTLLTEVAANDLQAIFGPGLVMHNSGAYLAPGTGNASLGCLIPASPPTLFCTTYGAKTKLRIAVNTYFGDGNAVTLDFSVTDIRMYLPDFTTPDASLVSGFNNRMRSENLVMGVGVGYPYQTNQTAQAVHWLQVNALHLSDTNRQLN